MLVEVGLADRARARKIAELLVDERLRLGAEPRARPALGEIVAGRERRLEPTRLVKCLSASARIDRIRVDLRDERVDVRRFARALGPHELVAEPHEKSRAAIGARKRQRSIEVRIAKCAIAEARARLDGDEGAR